MKRILTATAIAAALAAGNTQAGNTSGTFNVNVTLTSSCTLAAVTDLAFAYTSLQPGVSNATGGGFSVSCTNTLPYTFGLQSGNGAATPPGAATIAVTDNAVNLGYSLGLSAAGGTGNGLVQPYSVTGTMAASQAGTCAAASCTNAAATNKTHTLIVNY
jgi:spore coat protein U-like protein